MSFKTVILLTWMGFLVLSGIPAGASQMILQLSGDLEYPGVLALKKGNRQIQRLCFVGIQGQGQMDRGFIRQLAGRGVPSGDYRVTGPLPQENWPPGTFLKNGALRLQPVSGTARSRMQQAERKGVAIHGRDFYPIVMPLAKTKELVDFYNDQLFERLTRHWGALRITNWDMDRLHDFWKRNTETPDEWRVRIHAASPDSVRKLCQPPVVKRKPD